MKRLSLGLVAIVIIAAVAGYSIAGRADEIHGTVKRVDAPNMRFVINNEKGVAQTFEMDEDAQVYVNDQAVLLSDLQPGDSVRVMARRDEDQWLAISVYCTR